MITRRTAIQSALSTLVGVMTPSLGWAQQAFPTRPLKFISPYAAGGFTDVVIRVVGEGMSAKLQQPVVVENKTGANGLIALNATADATPDGYTVRTGATISEFGLPDLGAAI